MFETSKYQITDKEFLDSFVEQNILYKVATNLVLKKKIESDNHILSKHLKPLYLQMLENYVGISETVLMFLYAQLEKRLNNNKSYLFHFTQIFVKEGDNWNTKKILELLKNSQPDDLYDKFGLIKPNEILFKMDKEQLSDLEEKFGSIDKAIKQGNNEFINIINNLNAVLHNRIKNVHEEKLDLYRIYNKLKHGAQFIDIPDSNNIYIISKVESISSYESNCNVYYLECTKEGACFLAEQSKLISQSLENLIGLISYSLQN